MKKFAVAIPIYDVTRYPDQNGVIASSIDTRFQPLIILGAIKNIFAEYDLQVGKRS